MQVGLSMLIASLTSSLNLKRPTKPDHAPIMIIKAYDMTDSSSSSWQAFLQTLQVLDIQASAWAPSLGVSWRSPKTSPVFVLNHELARVSSP